MPVRVAQPGPMFRAAARRTQRHELPCLCRTYPRSNCAVSSASSCEYPPTPTFVLLRSHLSQGLPDMLRNAALT